MRDKLSQISQQIINVVRGRFGKSQHELLMRLLVALHWTLLRNLDHGLGGSLGFNYRNNVTEQINSSLRKINNLSEQSSLLS